MLLTIAIKSLLLLSGLAHATLFFLTDGVFHLGASALAWLAGLVFIMRGFMDDFDAVETGLFLSLFLAILASAAPSTAAFNLRGVCTDTSWVFEASLVATALSVSAMLANAASKARARIGTISLTHPILVQGQQIPFWFSGLMILSIAGSAIWISTLPLCQTLRLDAPIVLFLTVFLSCLIIYFGGHISRLRKSGKLPA